MFGVLAYVKFYYTHMYVAHVKLHHKLVATYEDTNTSRLNESLYQYLARAIPGGMAAVWRYKSDSKSKSWFENEMVKHLFYSASLFSVLTLAFNLRASLFSLFQGVLCMVMIEMVNYIEHYGLERKKDSNGNYESVNIRHSWNAPQVITNFMLFKLQRHSDHHANVYKPYQILESLPESPELPHGYSASIILATVPSQWYLIANPLAEAANKNLKVSSDQLREVNQRAMKVLIPFFSFVTLSTLAAFYV